MGVKEIECKADWDKFVRDAGRKAIICDFVATWCGPCKMMGPKFVRMEKEFPNVFFCKVDVDEYEDFAQDCEVSVMPTFQVFIEGKKVDECIGANEDNLKALCKKYNDMYKM